ncbi:MAG TPA: hypothetical protein VGZ00_11000 [Candidatus Baltobacteraceae bacterium]|jgi:hypothetical protein|nr:hypothetical protein [Candidatus Baltobacteraceae bacterium]
MSDQQETEQNGAREAILKRAWDILKVALDGKAIVVNDVNGSIDFDKGTVVVEHASVFEPKRLKMLMKDVHRYGDRTAVFGPSLTNDEIETLKTYFRVATVARSEDELQEWAGTLDRSGVRSLSESIEHASETVKPVTTVAEMIRTAKELLATAKELLVNAKDLLLVGIAGHQVAKVMALDLALQSTQEALGRFLTIDAATGTFIPLSNMIRSPATRDWLAGTVENSFVDAKAVFSKRIRFKNDTSFPHRRSQTRDHGSSRERDHRSLRH